MNMALDLSSLGPKSNKVNTVPGDMENSPFIIVGLFNCRALGDFIICNIVASSIKKQFKHARLYIYCRDDRDYKLDILNMNTYIDGAFCMSGERTFSLDDFDSFGDIISMGWKIPKFITRHKTWYDNNCGKPHLVLTPSMMNEHLLSSFASPAHLSISGEKIDTLTRRLSAKGLDPDRWYSVIHYREPTYSLRPSRKFRDVAPGPFQDVTNRIIRDLGGQVVRVGHPGMASFDKQDGFVDLAGEEENAFEIQAFAISRARFMLAVSSGPLQVGSAFGTPAASTNSINPAESPGVWNAHDLCLHRNLFLADGTRITAEAAMNHGLYDRGRLLSLVKEKRLTVMENSPEELFEIAKSLHGATTDTDGWRTPISASDPGFIPPNCLSMPCEIKRKVSVVEYPDLARQAYEARRLS